MSILKQMAGMTLTTEHVTIEDLVVEARELGEMRDQFTLAVDTATKIDEMNANQNIRTPNEMLAFSASFESAMHRGGFDFMLDERPASFESSTGDYSIEAAKGMAARIWDWIKAFAASMKNRFVKFFTRWKKVAATGAESLDQIKSLAGAIKTDKHEPFSDDFVSKNFTYVAKDNSLKGATASELKTTLDQCLKAGKAMFDIAEKSLIVMPNGENPVTTRTAVLGAMKITAGGTWQVGAEKWTVDLPTGKVNFEKLPPKKVGKNTKPLTPQEVIASCEVLAPSLETMSKFLDTVSKQLEYFQPFIDKYQKQGASQAQVAKETGDDKAAKSAASYRAIAATFGEFNGAASMVGWVWSSTYNQAVQAMKGSLACYKVKNKDRDAALKEEKPKDDAKADNKDGKTEKPADKDK